MSNKHPASGDKLSQIWLHKAAFHYDAHVHLGLSIRALARKSAGHASTILRQVRRIGALQSDPQVKAALAQLKSSRGEGADPAPSCQPGQSLNKDVMHLLEPKNAVLVMSENVEMAGIFLISSEYAPQKLGLVPRARAVNDRKRNAALCFRRSLIALCFSIKSAGSNRMRRSASSLSAAPQSRARNRTRFQRITGNSVDDVG